MKWFLIKKERVLLKVSKILGGLVLGCLKSGFL